MLNLIFQKAKAKEGVLVCVDSRAFFSMEKKAEWFQDPFVQKILSDVDGATVVDGMVLKDRDGNIVPPEYMSTGSKTAICVYEFPDIIFNATQMGDNAFKYVIWLSKERDITVLVYRDLPWLGLKDIEVCKDYQPIKFDGWLDFYEHMDEWLEEIIND